eukprot:TRINITY_DN1390_c0_g2_i3.p1 TRINITY_DN1390_c0_g2~~TRINITY_DN1390_c0_g2_i3.p1  ORF type:complete len:623 (+),score=149.85 TRINITY_DN1390_c0_g2_i3:1241-3109(+)
MRAMQVCKRWKNVLQSPKLWPRLNLHSHDYTVTNKGVKQLSRYCTEVKHIFFCTCHHLTDAGVVYIVQKNPMLRVLTLHNCDQITDDALLALPSTIQVLSTRGCKNITSAGLQTIGESCPNVEELFLGSCVGVDDRGLRHIASGCSKLQTLDLNGCRQITDQGLAEIKSLKRLRGLNLSYCQSISDHGLIPVLLNCHQLQYLSLESCVQVTDRAFVALKQACVLDPESHPIQQWQILNLKGCIQITDAGMMAIAPFCGQMLALCINGMRNIHDRSIVQIMKSTNGNLQYINMQYCRFITDETLRAIAQCCPHLKHINTTNCREITDEGVTAMAEACLNIKHVELTNCRELTDVSLIAIAENCRQTRHLDLRGCKRLTNQSIVCLSNLTELRNLYCSRANKITTEGIRTLCEKVQEAGTSNLENIYLSNCTNLTDEAIECMAKSLPALQLLDVHGCIQISDHAIKALAEHGKLIQILNLKQCSAITDRSLAYIINSEFIDKLRHINLEGCKNLSSAGLVEFAKKCPELQGASLSQCHRLNDTVIEALFEHCKNLRSLFVLDCPLITLNCIRSVRKLLPRCKISHNLPIQPQPLQLLENFDFRLEINPRQINGGNEGGNGMNME